MTSYLTHSPEETQSLVDAIMSNTQTNIIGLIGDLGSGKTTFIQGLGTSLGINDHITSPTFIVLKRYSIENHPRFSHLIHVDAYRIHSWDELVTIGLNELWEDSTNLVCIEWADNIADYLPQNTQYITFIHQGLSDRLIKVS